MFRNLRYYHLDSIWPENEDAVSRILQNAEFKPCGPYYQRGQVATKDVN